MSVPSGWPPLERNAVSVWWDKNLQVRDDFRETIAIELDGVTCVIVLWSALSVVPGNFLLSEASRAQQRKVLLPVLIDAVQPPLGLDQLQ